MKKNYKRILLKISGELFAKENGKGFSITACSEVAKKIAKIKKDNDIELAIVIGGGNIFRGREIGEEKFDKVSADYMGMLGTIINGLGLEECLEQLGISSRLMSGISMDIVAETFSKRKAIHHLSKGRVLIFAGGTGSPYFSTDTASALRACEINCDLVLKATNVDGVYDKDPDKFDNAKMYKTISYKEAIEKNLDVMDITAFSLCWENKKPIIVFNIKDLDKISKIIKGESVGTLVN